MIEGLLRNIFAVGLLNSFNLGMAPHCSVNWALVPKRRICIKCFFQFASLSQICLLKYSQAKRTSRAN